MAIEIDIESAGPFSSYFECLLLMGTVNSIDTKEIFENIFAGYDDAKEKCILRFASASEMKKHGHKINYRTRETCIKLINNFFENITGEVDKRCECIPSIFHWLGELREALADDMELKNEASAGKVKASIEGLKKAISRFKNCEKNCYEAKNDLLRELDKLMEEFYLLQFPSNLLGCYYREYHGTKNLIFICRENIKDVWENKLNSDFYGYDDLFRSVIIHEYAHFVDANTERHALPRNKKDKILYSALRETIAETVQKIYIDEICKSQAVKDWINDHSSSRNFPGWGYAGANILAKAVEVGKLAEIAQANQTAGAIQVITKPMPDLKDLLIKVIELSREDWKSGYNFVNSIRLLEEV